MLYILNISFALFVAFTGVTTAEHRCTCPNKASGAFYDCDLPVSVYANKKRYLISDILTMNWWESLGHCRTINMHLGVVFNLNELEILKTSVLPGVKYWLSGYSINNVTGHFVWLSSGLEVRNDFWPEGQPADGDCVVVSDAGLASASCKQQLPFICQQYDA
ncbi:C-type lectin 37Db-like [Cimex lectularius]|uniref:C-type lectin domain-containing protein n=1 Tax=Cimex lectularius TaxID=79782 RepID=A0A8I6RYC6_CIMLE|nr:C-type lectin 37Db-like [Cimex lectularius]